MKTTKLLIAAVIAVAMLGLAGCDDMLEIMTGYGKEGGQNYIYVTLTVPASYSVAAKYVALVPFADEFASSPSATGSSIKRMEAMYFSTDESGKLVCKAKFELVKDGYYRLVGWYDSLTGDQKPDSLEFAAYVNGATQFQVKNKQVLEVAGEITGSIAGATVAGWFN